jgi:mRNA interferase HigB
MVLYDAPMRVVGRAVLNTFLRNHPERANAKVPLETWHRVVKAARWQTPADVKATYRHASVLKDGRVVFNIAGNSFRMVAMIDYQRGIVRVRWFGTHAEYNRIDVEAV